MTHHIPQVCADDRYQEARECILAARYPSIAVIQRTLLIGYNRAERLMQALIAAGVVEESVGEHGLIYKVKK